MPDEKENWKHLQESENCTKSISALRDQQRRQEQQENAHRDAEQSARQQQTRDEK